MVATVQTGGKEQVVVSRFNSEGGTIWTKQIVNSTTNTVFTLAASAVDPAGDLVLGLTSIVNNGTYRAVAQKLTKESGSLLWLKTFALSVCFGITVDAVGHVIVGAGYDPNGFGSAFVEKLNGGSGATIWNRTGPAISSGIRSIGRMTYCPVDDSFIAVAGFTSGEALLKLRASNASTVYQTPVTGPFQIDQSDASVFMVGPGSGSVSSVGRKVRPTGGFEWSQELPLRFHSGVVVLGDVYAYLAEDVTNKFLVRFSRSGSVLGSYPLGVSAPTVLRLKDNKAILEYGAYFVVYSEPDQTLSSNIPIPIGEQNLQMTIDQYFPRTSGNIHVFGRRRLDGRTRSIMFDVLPSLDPGPTTELYLPASSADAPGPILPNDNGLFTTTSWNVEDTEIADWSSSGSTIWSAISPGVGVHATFSKTSSGNYSVVAPFGNSIDSFLHVIDYLARSVIRAEEIFGFRLHLRGGDVITAVDRTIRRTASSTGEVLWEFTVPAASNSTGFAWACETEAGTGMFLDRNNGRTVVFDLDSGTIYTIRSGGLFSLKATGNHVVGIGGNSAVPTFVRLSPHGATLSESVIDTAIPWDLTVLFQIAQDGAVLFTYVNRDATTWNYTIKRLDAITGTTVWATTTPTYNKGTLATTTYAATSSDLGGDVYFFGAGNLNLSILHILDRQTGAIRETRNGTGSQHESVSTGVNVGYTSLPRFAVSKSGSVLLSSLLSSNFYHTTIAYDRLRQRGSSLAGLFQAVRSDSTSGGLAALHNVGGDAIRLEGSSSVGIEAQLEFSSILRSPHKLTGRIVMSSSGRTPFVVEAYNFSNATWKRIGGLDKPSGSLTTLTFTERRLAWRFVDPLAKNIRLRVRSQDAPNTDELIGLSLDFAEVKVESD